MYTLSQFIGLLGAPITDTSYSQYIINEYDILHPAYWKAQTLLEKITIERISTRKSNGSTNTLLAFSQLLHLTFDDTVTDLSARILNMILVWL
jgi:hypothetical protein